MPKEMREDADANAAVPCRLYFTDRSQPHGRDVTFPSYLGEVGELLLEAQAITAPFAFARWRLRGARAALPGSRDIHLINPFGNASGGSEWRALNLFEHLQPHAKVVLWGSDYADPALSESFPIRPIRTKRLSFPKTGTFVFIGVYFPVGRWIWAARPRRAVIMYNTSHPDKLAQLRRRLSRAFGFEPEIAYTSEMLRKEADFPGPVERSLFDLRTFLPIEARPDRPFTIGRLSRDAPAKHHSGDLNFYRSLAEQGCHVEVMGAPATMIEAHAAAPREEIRLRPCCSVPAPQFLQGLDCFYYRTGSWVEPWGRVVSEAMACGLPVVAESRGGYAEIIEHGRNGFLFNTEEEARAILLRLRDDPELRRIVGEAARRTAERLLSAAVRSRIAQFYLA